MEKNKTAFFEGFLLSVLGLTLLAAPLFGQKDFNMDEEKLIDTFKRANPLYLGGAELFAKGNLDKAEKKLLECLAVMPEHADASYVLAQVHLKRKEFPQALAAITLAEKNYVANAKFQNFSHQDYLDRLRQQRAGIEDKRAQVQETLSRMASGSNPEKGRLEQEIQTYVQSIREIDRRLNSPVATVIEIPADYLYIHGNVLFRLGRTVDAAAQYREALRLAPRHGNSFNNLALVLFSMGNYREALDCLAQAEAAGVKINPDFKKAVEAKVTQQ